MRLSAELNMYREIYKHGVEKTNKVMAGRSTADKEHIGSSISLHVGDRHLRGLEAVAKQQPSPLFTFLSFPISHIDVFLPGEKCKVVGRLLWQLFYLTILTRRL